MLTITRVTIGDNLRRLREEQLLTQQELADHAGVGVATVARIENNVITEPRFRSIKKLATALGVEASELVKAS